MIKNFWLLLDSPKKHDKKKRESLYPLLVPLIEAVACAHLSRTSNAEPHAV